MEEIIIGGGCFWCIEAIFKRVEGVKEAVSGYSGGETVSPTYEQIYTVNTGHVEVVKVVFNPKKININEILRIFLLAHDPTSYNKQGYDEGEQYKSVIFCTSQEQLNKVKKYLGNAQSNYDNKIVTVVSLLDKFYPAEDYHQEYYENNRNARYCRLVIDPKIKKVFE